MRPPLKSFKKINFRALAALVMLLVPVLFTSFFGCDLRAYAQTPAVPQTSNDPNDPSMWATDTSGSQLSTGAATTKGTVPNAFYNSNQYTTMIQQQTEQYDPNTINSTQMDTTVTNDLVNDLLLEGTTTTAGSMGDTYMGLKEFWSHDMVSQFFHNIGQLIGKWFTELIHGWISPIVQYLTGALRTFVLNPNIAVNGVGNDTTTAGKNDNISGYVRKAADVMYGIAIDLLLLLFILCIWKMWIEQAWRGGVGVMGAVGRLIWTAGLLLAWPTIYAFVIEISNEMIHAVYFNSTDEIQMMDVAMAQAVEAGLVGGGALLLRATAPILGAAAIPVVGGAVGGVISMVCLIIFLILGGVLIAELVYILILKAIQTALLTMQYMFAPIFLVFYATPTTERIATGYVQAFVECSLWTFVWVGMLKVLVILLFSDFNPWGKILVAIGVLQLMIQVPTFMARASISPMSDFISAGLVTGGLLAGAGALSGAVGNAAKQFKGFEFNKSNMAAGSPRSLNTELDVGQPPGGSMNPDPNKNPTNRFDSKGNPLNPADPNGDPKNKPPTKAETPEEKKAREKREANADPMSGIQNQGLNALQGKNAKADPNAPGLGPPPHYAASGAPGGPGSKDSKDGLPGSKDGVAGKGAELRNTESTGSLPGGAPNAGEPVRLAQGLNAGSVEIGRSVDGTMASGGGSKSKSTPNAPVLEAGSKNNKAAQGNELKSDALNADAKKLESLGVVTADSKSGGPPKPSVEGEGAQANGRITTNEREGPTGKTANNGSPTVNGGVNGLTTSAASLLAASTQVSGQLVGPNAKKDGQEGNVTIERNPDGSTMDSKASKTGDPSIQQGKGSSLDAASRNLTVGGDSKLGDQTIKGDSKAGAAGGLEGPDSKLNTQVKETGAGGARVTGAAANQLNAADAARAGQTAANGGKGAALEGVATIEQQTTESGQRGPQTVRADGSAAGADSKLNTDTQANPNATLQAAAVVAGASEISARLRQTGATGAGAKGTNPADLVNGRTAAEGARGLTQEGTIDQQLEQGRGAATRADVSGAPGGEPKLDPAGSERLTQSVAAVAGETAARLNRTTTPVGQNVGRSNPADLLRGADGVKGAASELVANLETEARQGTTGNLNMTGAGAESKLTGANSQESAVLRTAAEVATGSVVGRVISGGSSIGAASGRGVNPADLLSRSTGATAIGTGGEHRVDMTTDGSRVENLVPREGAIAGHGGGAGGHGGGGFGGGPPLGGSHVAGQATLGALLGGYVMGGSNTFGTGLNSSHAGGAANGFGGHGGNGGGNVPPGGGMAPTPGGSNPRPDPLVNPGAHGDLESQQAPRDPVATAYATNNPMRGVDPTQKWNSSIYSGLPSRMVDRGIRTTEMWQRDSENGQSSIAGSWAEGPKGFMYGANMSPEQKALLRMTGGYANALREDPVGNEAARQSAIQSGADQPQTLSERIAHNLDTNMGGLGWGGSRAAGVRMEQAMWQESVKGASAYLKGESGNAATEYLRTRYGPVSDKSLGGAIYASTHPDSPASGWNPAIDAINNTMMNQDGLDPSDEHRSAYGNSNVRSQRPNLRPFYGRGVGRLLGVLSDRDGKTNAPTAEKLDYYATVGTNLPSGWVGAAGAIEMYSANPAQDMQDLNLVHAIATDGSNWGGSPDRFKDAYESNTKLRQASSNYRSGSSSSRSMSAPAPSGSSGPSGPAPQPVWDNSGGGGGGGGNYQQTAYVDVPPPPPPSLSEIGSGLGSLSPAASSNGAPQTTVRLRGAAASAAGYVNMQNMQLTAQMGNAQAAPNYRVINDGSAGSGRGPETIVNADIRAQQGSQQAAPVNPADLISQVRPSGGSGPAPTTTVNARVSYDGGGGGGGGGNGGSSSFSYTDNQSPFANSQATIVNMLKNDAGFSSAQLANQQMMDVAYQVMANSASGNEGVPERAVIEAIGAVAQNLPANQFTPENIVAYQVARESNWGANMSGNEILAVREFIEAAPQGTSMESLRQGVSRQTVQQYISRPDYSPRESYDNSQILERVVQGSMISQNNPQPYNSGPSIVQQNSSTIFREYNPNYYQDQGSRGRPRFNERGNQGGGGGRGRGRGNANEGGDDAFDYGFDT